MNCLFTEVCVQDQHSVCASFGTSSLTILLGVRQLCTTQLGWTRGISLAAGHCCSSAPQTLLFLVLLLHPQVGFPWLVSSPFHRPTARIWPKSRGKSEFCSVAVLRQYVCHHAPQTAPTSCSREAHASASRLTWRLARSWSHISTKLPDCRAGAPPTVPEGPKRLANPTGDWAIPARRRASLLFRFSCKTL